MKKIMFNDRYGLTQAVIEGRKTMTRRMISGYPLQPSDRIEAVSICPDGFVSIIANGGESLMEVKCHYKVGEIVAVAQSYSSFYDDTYNPVLFPAGAGWNNKMFVKPELMPHRIRITGIKGERLQDISDADCLKEGIRYFPEINKFYFEDIRREEGFYFDNPREAFAALINKVFGRGTWDGNPWVEAHEFNLLK